MKRLLPLALSVLFVFSPSAAIAAEDEIPVAGMEAIGSLSAMSSYISHVAFGRIADADHTGNENLKKAAQDTGGIQAGLTSAKEYLAKAKAQAAESEHEGIDVLVGLTDLCVKQAGALLELLKAKSNDEDVQVAQKNFDTARLNCAKGIAKNLGIPLELLE